MERSDRKGKWEFVGEVIVNWLWAMVFLLADLDFWLVVAKAAGIL